MSLRADVSFVKEHAQVCSVMFSDVWRAAGSRIMMYLPIKKVLVIRLLSRWLLEQFDNDEMIWRQMMDRMYLLDAYDVATRCSLSSEIGERRLRFLKLWTQDQLRWKRTDYLKHMCHSFHRNSTFSAIPGKRSMRYSRIVDAEGNLGGGGPGQRRLAVEYSYGLIPREGPLSLGNPRCVDAVDTDGQVQRIDLLARQSLLQQGVVGGKLSVPNGYRTFYPLSGSCYAFVWASKDYLIVSLHDGTFAYLDHIKLPIDTAISCMTANDLPENSDVEFGSSLQRVNKLGSATSSDSLCQSVKEPPVQRMEPPVQRMEPPVQRQRSMDSNCETPTLPTTYVFGMADGRVFITTRKLTQALIMLPLLQSPVSALQVSDDGKTIVVSWRRNSLLEVWRHCASVDRRLPKVWRCVCRVSLIQSSFEANVVECALYPTSCQPTSCQPTSCRPPGNQPFGTSYPSSEGKTNRSWHSTGGYLAAPQSSDILGELVVGVANGVCALPLLSEAAELPNGRMRFPGNVMLQCNVEYALDNEGCHVTWFPKVGGYSHCGLPKTGGDSQETGELFPSSILELLDTDVEEYAHIQVDPSTAGLPDDVRLAVSRLRSSSRKPGRIEEVHKAFCIYKGRRPTFTFFWKGCWVFCQRHMAKLQTFDFASASNKLVTNLLGHAHVIYQAAFDNESNRLLTVDRDENCVLWDLVRCRKIAGWNLLTEPTEGEEDFATDPPGSEPQTCPNTPPSFDPASALEVPNGNQDDTSSSDLDPDKVWEGGEPVHGNGPHESITLVNGFVHGSDRSGTGHERHRSDSGSAPAVSLSASNVPASNASASNASASNASASNASVAEGLIGESLAGEDLQLSGLKQDGLLLEEPEDYPALAGSQPSLSEFSTQHAPKIRSRWGRNNTAALRKRPEDEDLPSPTPSYNVHAEYDRASQHKGVPPLFYEIAASLGVTVEEVVANHERQVLWESQHQTTLPTASRATDEGPEPLSDPKPTELKAHPAINEDATTAEAKATTENDPSSLESDPPLERGHPPQESKHPQEALKSACRRFVSERPKTELSIKRPVAAPPPRTSRRLISALARDIADRHQKQLEQKVIAKTRLPQMRLPRPRHALSQVILAHDSLVLWFRDLQKLDVWTFR